MWNWDKASDRAAPAACSSPESFLTLCQAMANPYFGACIGATTSICSPFEKGVTPGRMIEVLGSRYVIALHLHDNDGWHDLHRASKAEGGTVPWAKILSALRTIGYQGDLVAENATAFQCDARGRGSFGPRTKNGFGGFPKRVIGEIKPSNIFPLEDRPLEEWELFIEEERQIPNQNLIHEILVLVVAVFVEQHQIVERLPAFAVLKHAVAQEERLALLLGVTNPSLPFAFFARPHVKMEDDRAAFDVIDDFKGKQIREGFVPSAPVLQAFFANERRRKTEIGTLGGQMDQGPRFLIRIEGDLQGIGK